MKKWLAEIFLLLLIVPSLSAQSIYYVRTDGSDGNTGLGNTASGAKATLSSAISAASAGDIIQLGAGSFSGSGFTSLTLSGKYLHIIGSGSGSNPATSTVITGSSGTFITLNKGASSTNRMEVSNLYIKDFAVFFDEVDSNSLFYNVTVQGLSSYAQFVWRCASGASGIEIDRCTISNVWAWSTQNVSGEGGNVFRSSNDRNLYNVNVRNSSFNNNFINFFIAQSSAPSSKKDADNINIYNCYFTGGQKAFYAERLDNCTFQNCTFDQVGTSTYSHPAAIDLNLKWNTYTGNISIRYCHFTGCAVPSSGTDVNGAALLFKVRDFGSYASTPASFSGTFKVDGCIFTGNNAGIRVGESSNGSGTGSGENSHFGSGAIEIRNSILQSNTGGSYQTYNHFGVRNCSTRNIDVINSYFGGGSATTNTAFSGPVDVSTPNTSGTTGISGTLTTGGVVRLNSSSTYQANYASFASALSGASDGDIVIAAGSSISGTTDINKNLTLYVPGSGALASGSLMSFATLKVSGNKTFTMGSDVKAGTVLDVGAGNTISIGDYNNLLLGGSITSGGTFSGGTSGGSPTSNIQCTGTGNITLPQIGNGIKTLVLSRGSSDTLQLGNDATVNNINIQSSVLSLNSKQLEVLAITEANTGSIDGSVSGSTLKLSGTTQNFPLGAGTYMNLIMNRSQGVTLAGNITIGNSITFTNGSVTLGSFNCTLESGASVGGTPSAGSMFIATGSGEVRRKFTATGSFDFPVGDDVGTFEYSPITLNFTSGSFGSGAYASVNLQNVKHPNNASSTDFLTRYWTVNQNNITGFSCTVTGTYVNADINGTEGNLVGAKYSSSVWTNMGAVNAGANQLGGTVTGFSAFTGGEAAALPVEWLDFMANLSGADVLLNWTTASERNSAHFDVERSYDGKDFKVIGKVMAAGNSAVPVSYLFADAGVQLQYQQVVYYRLRQFDQDGAFSFSPVRYVDLSAKKRQTNPVTVFPSPFTEGLSFHFVTDEQVQQVQLTDVNGSEIALQGFDQAGSVYTLKGLSGICNGTYILHIQTASGIYHSKVLK